MDNFHYPIELADENLRRLLLTLSPSARDTLRTVLIRDDRDGCWPRSTPQASYLAAEVALGNDEIEFARSLLPEAAETTTSSNAHALAQACVHAELPAIAEGYLESMDVDGVAEEAARLAGRAILAEARGEVAAARESYAEAARLFRSESIPPDHARSLQACGRCLVALGEIVEGRMRLMEARALWEPMGATRRIAEIDVLLGAV